MKTRRTIRQPTSDTVWLGSDESFIQFKAHELQLNALTPTQLESIQIRGTVMSDDDATDSVELSDEYGDYGYMVSTAPNHRDVAILDISGALVPKDSWINRYYGRVSYEEIRGASIAALKAGKTALLMNYDTGGGNASGIMELSDFLHELDKQIAVYSYTGTNMLSGGYWLGAVGRRIYSNQMAMVGSIGVITAHFSYHRALKEQGVDVTMIRAGEFKALGSPYEKLDDVAKADIQGKLDKTYELFTSHISAERDIPVGKLIETAAEGRTFFGSDAIGVGLVDAVMSFDAVVEDVAKRSKRKLQVAGPNNFQSPNMKGVDMKRSLNAAGHAAVASGLALEVALKDPALSQEGEVTSTTEEADLAAAPVATNAAPEPAAAPAAADVSASEQATLLDRLMAVTTELAQTKALLTTAQAAVEAANGNEKSLMKIAVESVNRMSLAMNQATVKVEDLTPQTLVSLHARTQSQFGERFRIGAVAETAADNDLGNRTEVSVRPVAASNVKF